MKTYLLFIAFVLTAFVLTAFTEKGTPHRTSSIQSDAASGIPVGLYVWDSKTEDVWNDSIRIYADTLIVYKDPGYGYGRIISFTYQFKVLDTYKLLLTASSMDPEGMFVLPAQYDWHLDTLELKIPQGDSLVLLGPNKEAYTLKSTTSKLH